MNSDYRDLLWCFAEAEVRYLVVGGYAVIFHAEPRFTADLDLWIEPAPDNADRVMRAFSEFGLPLTGGIEPDDFARPGTQYMIGVAPCAIDFLTTVPGLEFPGAWENRVVVDDDGIPVNYLCRSDLVTAKKSADRQRDRMDLELLGEEE
ncbi:MAG: hypothetical protein KDM63_20550 [Verrucomicrobiae bacterium]|nr:hypothetical protein [Verrucomicrobiae bacterium]